MPRHNPPLGPPPGSLGVVTMRCQGGRTIHSMSRNVDFAVDDVLCFTGADCDQASRAAAGLPAKLLVVCQDGSVAYITLGTVEACMTVTTPKGKVWQFKPLSGI